MKTRLGKLTAFWLASASLLTVFLAATFQGCGGQGGQGGNKVTLILGGYTTPREAYGKAVIPEFQKF